MKNWKIKAIKAGTLTLTKAAGIGGGVDDDIIIDFPFTCFLLQNGEENILVDTGMKDGYVEQMQIGDVPATGSTQMLIDGLSEEGLKPEDIDAVIYTHLHYDHCGNGDLFLNVPTYIQKSEYANLMNPYDFQKARADYFPDTYEWIPKLKRMILVDGTLKMANGLELYHVTGHSLGGQAVVVPTANGRYVLSGDTPTSIWALFPEMDKMTLMDGTVIDVTPVTNVKFVNNGFINDMFGYYDSCNLILGLAEKPAPEYFIPSHEPQNIYRKYWG